MQRQLCGRLQPGGGRRQSAYGGPCGGLTPTYFAEQHRGVAAVQQNIAYKQELLAGNIVEVRRRALEIGNKSLRLLHEMWNAETQELSASCELTVVHMDRRERKAAVVSGTATGSCARGNIHDQGGQYPRP